jgi:hypothetical protein
MTRPANPSPLRRRPTASASATTDSQHNHTSIRHDHNSRTRSGATSGPRAGATASRRADWGPAQPIIAESWCELATARLAPFSLPETGATFRRPLTPGGSAGDCKSCRIGAACVKRASRWSGLRRSRRTSSSCVASALRAPAPDRKRRRPELGAHCRQFARRHAVSRPRSPMARAARLLAVGGVLAAAFEGLDHEG